MNRSDLIQELAEVAKISKDEAQLVIETILSEISESLVEGRRVEIRGFGSFQVRAKNARRGRNPKTGTAIQIEQKLFPHFKPGKDLKDLCRQQDESASSGSGDYNPPKSMAAR